MEFIRSVFYGRRGLPPDVKRILEQYGNEIIVKLHIRRYPIDSNITKALNFILSVHNRNIPFDKFFHLSLYVETHKGTKLLIEKNYVFHMEVNPRTFPDTQAMEVYLPSPQSVNFMIQKTMKDMDNKFFTYSTLNNNCQDFMVSFLKVNGLLSDTLLHFVKQDVKDSFDGMISLRKALNTATDIASRFDVLKQGGSESLSKHNGLTSTQLDKLLSHVTTFGGCYSKDKLPTQLKKGYWYIANMQNERDGNGTHWVCFKYGYPVCYYDPFGIAPPIEIMKVVKRELIWNGKQIQDEGSTACGWFCVACILSDYEQKHRDTLTHFNRFINCFSRNTNVNDNVLRKILNYYNVV